MIDRAALCPVFDIDYLVYRSGFSADTQAKEAYGTEHYLEHDYLPWALGNVKTSMTRMLEEEFKSAEWHVVYIGGEGNYRNTIANAIPKTIEGWKYKGNRDALHKPKYFAEIREYLVSFWSAIPVNGMETDDAVSIHHYKHPDRSTCIVSQDKDLANTPGWHYNPVTREFSYITLRQANLNFQRQTLTGDWGSDYIPGLEGIADKTAEKIMKGCEYKPHLIERETLKLYQKQFGPLGREVMIDNQNLLWIQRELGVGFDGRKLEIA